MFRQMMRDPIAPRMMNSPFRRSMDAEGYRVEIVDGERTEYVYEDGEWEEVGDASDEEGLDFDLSELDESYEMLIDLTSQLPNVGGSGSVEASLNNGVLNLTFESGSDEESDEE